MSFITEHIIVRFAEMIHIKLFRIAHLIASSILSILTLYATFDKCELRLLNVQKW